MANKGSNIMGLLFNPLVIRIINEAITNNKSPITKSVLTMLVRHFSFQIINQFINRFIG
jgi:hypothetical protein